MPGGNFFRLYDRPTDDFQWWRTQLTQSLAFDWTPFLDERPTNIALRDRAKLSTLNYILNPNPENHYWSNISSGKMREYIRSRGAAFNIVLAGDPNDETDFFVIPFVLIESALVAQFRSKPLDGRLRWIVTIKNQDLRVGSCPNTFPVADCYGNPQFLQRSLTHLETDSPEFDVDDDADHSGHTSTTEVETRIGQWKFHNDVFDNFQGRCCLTDISESDLLIASHIIPWSKRVDTRLDPANGLCLSVFYDRLFDKGYISFDDGLRVLATEKISSFSDTLRTQLAEINGVTARQPIRTPINTEYLQYHRDQVFLR